MPSARPVRAKQGSLSGRRILVTRARQQAGKLSTMLRENGATVIEIPSIEIRPPRSFAPLDGVLGKLGRYEWLILTSVNGVESLFSRLSKRRIKLDALGHLKVCAIGPATQAAIEKSGLKVDVVPERYVAESVVESLRNRVNGKRVLLVRAKVARDVIPQELRSAGAQVDVVEAYETVVPKTSKARLQTVLRNSRLRPDAITFTSSSTAKNFLELLGHRAAKSHVLDGVVLASIGPVTSETLREIGLRADIEAATFTMEGLVDALVARLANV